MATMTTVQYTDETQMYVRVTYDNGTQATVPAVAGNRHWQQVQAWAAAGNTIAPAPEPAPAPPTARPVVSGATDSEKLASVLRALSDAGIIIHAE